MTSTPCEHCRCQNEDFGSFALQTHIELLEMRVKELEDLIRLPAKNALEDYRNREAKASRITRLESSVFHPGTAEGA